MAVFNLGSINTDHIYRLPHFPAAGETLAAESYQRGLGGKGANQSVALARAGADVRHIGAVGADGLWMAEQMQALGVDCAHVATVASASGHAVIYLDAAAENQIILYSGTNRGLSLAQVEAALQGAGAGDWLVLQNETNLQVEAAQIAKAKGLSVAYSAAPFEAAAVQAVLPFVDVLLLNAVEAEQLCEATGAGLEALPVKAVCETHGAQGAVWHDLARGVKLRQAAFKVEARDTTGAGDTFAGFVIAALARGATAAEAMRLAAAASALKVTQIGAAGAIPSAQEVEQFLATHAQ